MSNKSIGPSFIYSSLDDETIELSNELKALGGGNAKVEQFKLYTVINQYKSNSKKKILWDYQSSIGLRDVLQPTTNSISQSMRYFNVNNTYNYNDILSNDNSLFNREIAYICNDLINGVNHCVLTYGERGSGKTTAFFQSIDHYKDSVQSYGFVSLVLSCLYSIEHITIGISSWVVQGDYVIDLCKAENVESSNSTIYEFLSVECPTNDVALEVISTTRKRSTGVLVQHQSYNEKDRAHYFLRLLVHNNKTNSLGILYIIDLIGPNLINNNKEIYQLNEIDRIHLRINSLQFLSLNKVFKEMIQLSNQISKGKIVTLTSARDTKLTTLLSPILCGNCCLSMYIFLLDHEDHFQSTKSTLLYTENLSTILCPVYRVIDIPIHSLKLKHHDTVLTMNYLIKQSNHNIINHNIDSVSEFGDVNLEQIATGDINISNRPSNNLTSPTNNSRSEVLDQIMDEFHNLMYKLNDPKPNYQNNISNDIQLPNNYSNVTTGIKANNVQTRVKPIEIDATSSSKNNNYISYDLTGNKVNDNEIKNTYDDDNHNNDGDNNNSSNNNNNNSSSSSSSNSDNTYVSVLNALQGLRLNATTSKDIKLIDNEILKHIQSSNNFNNNNPKDPFINNNDEDDQSVDSLSDDSKPNVTGSNKSDSTNHDYDIIYNNIGGIGSTIPKQYLPLSTINNNHKPSDFITNVNLNNNSTNSKEDSAKQDELIDSCIQQYENNINRLDSYANSNESEKPDVNIPLQDIDSNTNDVDRMQSLYKSFMDTIKYEREEKAELQLLLHDLKQELLEIKTQCDVDIHTIQLENIRLKNQLRTVCDNNALSDVYLIFEENVDRLIKENKLLRDRNIKLESKLIDIVVNHKEIFLSSPSKSNASRSSNTTSAAEVDIIDNSNIKIRLKDKLKKLILEKEELKLLNEDLLKKERLYHMSIKQNEETTKRIRICNTEIERLKNQLDNERRAAIANESDLNLLNIEIKEIHESDRKIRDERNRLIQEVSHLRARVKEIDEEKKRISLLNKFVSKHVNGDSSSKSSSQSSSKVKLKSNLKSDYTIGLNNNDVKFVPSVATSIDDSLLNTYNRNSSNNISIINQNTSNYPLNNITGLSGLSDAEYIRLEEAASLHPNLDNALAALRENIITHCPKLINIYKTLHNEIYIDQTRHVIDKSNILGKLYDTPKKTKFVTPSSKGSKSTNDLTVKSSEQNIVSSKSIDRIDFQDLRKRVKY